MMRRSLIRLLLLGALASPYANVNAQSTDSLEIGFRNSLASARPRTWWHWTQSNVTKDGITKDPIISVDSP